MKTFSSFSFGCRVNQAEKEALDRQLVERGYSYSDFKPDVYVINTCSVTNKAEREARQMINQLRKKYGDSTKIVVMGCAATNWIKTKAEVENADMLVENPSKEFIAELIEKKFGKKSTKQAGGLKSPVEADKTLQKGQNMPFKARLVEDKYIRSGRIILKVQDGCQRFCTYCIVPYLRGLPKTISQDDLIAEVNTYPDTIKEVIYTAINTEAFGYETKTEDFLDLVKSTLERTSTPRISFGSIHPWSVNEKLFELLRTHPQAHRIVKFFHVPLQSGNNKMLNLMKRGYTREEFVEKLHTLSSIDPFSFIGTDVIVGFLEETDRDFEDTYQFLESTPISKIHIFRYSPRQHTAAFYLGKRLKEPTPEEKLKRSKALHELNRRKYRQFQEKHVGQSFEALVLEQGSDGYKQALLSNQMPVVVKTAEEKTGQIINVKVDSLKNGGLIAVEV